MRHFLTVYDTGMGKKRIGKDVMMDLNGGYNLSVIAGYDEDGLLEKTLPKPCKIQSDNVPWDGDESDVLLRMDIETREWQWLSCLDMSKIKQLMIEFHFPFNPAVDVFRMVNNHHIPSVSDRVKLLEKLCETHILVHFHPNNCCGTTIYMGITYPNVFQCTYVRKDQIVERSISTKPIPDPSIDAPCVENVSDIILDGEPFWLRPTMVATVLGSCRQSLINTRMLTTDIQEKLSYPHYSKEILQEILFLKHEVDTIVPVQDTRYVFRSQLLSSCTQIIDQTLHDHLRKEFMRTDIFLVEIASRMSYLWKGYYLHHIAEEPEYSFPNRKDICIYEMLDDEIEDDLHEIQKQLHPKKFIIISHFATYQHGKRYELVKLLEKLCTQMDIPFWDQSRLIHDHGTEILKDNCHYTDHGKIIAASELYTRVQDTMFSNQKVLYNIYYTDKDRVAQHTFHGLGDFLRGTLFLYQECRKNGITLKINFSNHHLGRILVCNNHVSIADCQNAKYIFMFDDTDPFQYQHVFCNKFPTENVDDECRLFIRENCLRPRMWFEKKLSNYMRSHGLIKNEFVVIHVRLTDNEEYNEDRLASLRNTIQSIYQREPRKVLYIASSKCYHAHISFPFVVKTTGLQCGHLGQHSTTFRQAEDTMIEFMIMTHCAKIYQLSVYSWGSGFSEIVHQIYEIPLEKIQI